MKKPALELISFKLCPFVQRAVIVLQHKEIDFKITYIDLDNPPGWFKAISPLGQVPVLKVAVDGADEILFESAVIQEYVDEITPPSLHPTDPLIKAKNRAWMSFGDEILFAQHAMITHKEKPVCLEKESLIRDKLLRLEKVHSGNDYFNGEHFSLIDATYAPLMMRLAFIKTLCGQDLLSETPKLQRWSEVLLKLPSVQNSVVAELPSLYESMVNKMDGYLINQVKASEN